MKCGSLLLDSLCPKETMSEIELQSEMKPEGDGHEPRTPQDLLQRLRELEVRGLLLSS